MKYIKKYKLFETGEWNRRIDWKYTKDNPDDDCEEASWIRGLEETLNEVINELDNTKIFKIIDIRGFDLYQGPYAMVEIFDKKYKVIEVDYPEPPGLFIDDFPVDNCSESGYNSGFMGTTYEISELLNNINDLGGMKSYFDIQKYNI